MKVVVAFTLMTVFLGLLVSSMASEEDNLEMQTHISNIISGIEGGRIQRAQRHIIDSVKQSLKTAEEKVK